MDNRVDKLNSINITRVFPASKEKLFELWTNPALIKSWFSPGFSPGLIPEESSITAVEVNLRIGGQFRIVIEEPDGTQHIANGVYKKIIKPNILEFSWCWSDSDSNSPDTLVSIDYKTTNNGTEISLLHEQFDSIDSRDTHEQGWTKCLNCLESVI